VLRAVFYEHLKHLTIVFQSDKEAMGHSAGWHSNNATDLHLEVT